MEPTRLYTAKVEKYKKAILSFNSALGADLSLFEPVLSDLIMNGQVQKFEYCSELMWKALRLLLVINNNISAKSPKEVVKEFCNCGYADEKQYEVLLKILENMNRLSHVYNEEVFFDIHSKLKEYNLVMNEALNILEKVSII